MIDARSGSAQDLNTNSGRMFYQTIDFDNAPSGTASFKAKPVITASISLPGSTVTSDRNVGLICTVIAVTQTSFTVRVIKARELTAETGTTVLDPKPVQTFQINWIAIGPK